jgi:hypothetical protein
MKMENRVLVPMIWCYLLINLVWCVYLLPTQQVAGKKIMCLFIALITASTICESLGIYHRWYLRQLDNYGMTRIFKRLEEQPQNIIVVNANYLAKLHLQPFKTETHLKNKKLVSIDNCFYYMLPAYASYMKTLCGSDEPVKVMECLKQQKENTVFISSPARIEMLKGYFNTVYNMPLDFKTDSASQRESNKLTPVLFTIK